MRRIRLRRRTAVATLAGLVALAAAGGARATTTMEAGDLAALGRLSLEELAGIVVTSVARQPQPLAESPAALFVITHEDLVRSGATSLPEALALAPNLSVARSGANAWQIAPRGLAGNAGAQNFPNKLLVMIDGRSVWSPLFSGVYWDSQDVPLDDVDRIEVISGPGATLWGANAFNGVINVITRPAQDTTGLRAQAIAGTDERGAEARVGGTLGAHAAARVYVAARDRSAYDLPSGDSAGDGSTTVQAGFRLDAAFERDAFTLQGDALRDREDQPVDADVDVRGAHLLGRWQRTTASGADVQVQAYVDDVNRGRPTDGAAFRVRTYDLQFQHARQFGGRHSVVWGGGQRLIRYSIGNTPTLAFDPARDSLWLGNVYGQDTIALTPALHLTAGMKFERDPYSGWEPQPDLRIAWTPHPDRLWWAAASRAIRAPTPFDTGVVERVGALEFVRATRDFRPERVNAYQAGFRGRLAERFTLSVTAFRNVYDDLRTIEFASATTFLPLRWVNGLEGHAWGADAWASWQVTPRWRLNPGWRYVRKHLRFAAGASGLAGVDQAGLDARDQWSLTSSWDLGALAVDAAFRRQGPVPEAKLEAWSTLDVRVGWRATPHLDLALVGRNLLATSHVESTVPGAAAVAREGRLTATWRY